MKLLVRMQVKLDVEGSQDAGQEHLSAESSTAPPAAALYIRPLSNLRGK